MKLIFFISFLLVTARLFAQPSNVDPVFDDTFSVIFGVCLTAVVYLTYNVKALRNINMDGTGRLIAAAVLSAVVLSIAYGFNLYDQLVKLLNNPIVISLLVYTGIAKKVIGPSKSPILQPEVPVVPVQVPVPPVGVDHPMTDAPAVVLPALATPPIVEAEAAPSIPGYAVPADIQDAVKKIFNKHNDQRLTN